MAHFLVVYDPTKGNERGMIGALKRWKARLVIRGCWVLETDSTAELTRCALVAAGGEDLHCVIVEIKPKGDHAEMGADEIGRIVLRGVGGQSGDF